LVGTQTLRGERREDYHARPIARSPARTGGVGTVNAFAMASFGGSKRMPAR
jgi:hypothetical protein